MELVYIERLGLKNKSMALNNVIFRMGLLWLNFGLGGISKTKWISLSVQEGLTSWDTLNKIIKGFHLILSVAEDQMLLWFIIVRQNKIHQKSPRIWYICLIQEGNIWMEQQMLQERFISESQRMNKKIHIQEYYWGI